MSQPPPTPLQDCYNDVVAYRDQQPVLMSPSPGSPKLVVDDFHVLVIDALRHFYMGEDEFVGAMLRQLQRHPLARALRSYEEKVSLLSARHLRLMGDPRAVGYYSELLGHPLFREEAAAFVERG